MAKAVRIEVGDLGADILILHRTDIDPFTLAEALLDEASKINYTPTADVSVKDMANALIAEASRLRGFIPDGEV